MKVYLLCVLAFILADILTGLVKSLYEKDFKSSVMRQGLFHKAGELMVLGLLYGVEYAAPMLGITFELPTFRAGACYCILMEVGSIIENIKPYTPAISTILRKDEDNAD
jgi:phage-related holin